MIGRMSRKAFFATLGTAGVGLGLAAGSLGGAPLAFAQDQNGDQDDRPGLEAWADVDREALLLRAYEEFTTALASELGVSNVGDVDPAIRAAWSTVVDGLQADGLITAGQATAVKALIASTEVPVGPGPMFGHGPGMMAMRGQQLPDAAEGAGTDQTPALSERMQNRIAIGERLYPDFTAALTDALGAGSADEVDGAIRLAMMAAIDALASDDTLPAAPAEMLKAMVATADAPLGPGLFFGPPPGMFMRGLHGEGHGPMFGGPDKEGRERFGPRGDDDDNAGEEQQDDDSAAEEDDSAA